MFLRWMGIGVCLFALAAAGFFYARPSIPAASADEKEWETYITRVGGRAAYQDLSRTIATLPSSEQHTAAHRFGGALYAAEGVSGLAACDSQFSYGCFHEFLGRAIAEHGLDSVNTLNDECAEALGSGLSCQHGLGHGIVAYRGYEEEDLLASLTACDSLVSDTPGGCFGGVFMEYNTRSMLSGEEGVREAKDWRSPCTTVPNRYLRACHYTLPQWWHISLTREHEMRRLYEIMGERCGTFSGDARRSCYAGIGVEVITDMRGNVAVGEDLCKATGDGQALCLALATQAFSKDDSRRTSLCRSLRGEEKSQCELYGEDQNLVLTLQGFKI